MSETESYDAATPETPPMEVMAPLNNVAPEHVPEQEHSEPATPWHLRLESGSIEEFKEHLWQWFHWRARQD